MIFNMADDIDYKGLVKAINELDSDKEKLEVIQKNQKLGVTVYLDNDDMYATFDNDPSADDWDEPNMITFDNYVGWADGVFILFELLGIKAESV